MIFSPARGFREVVCVINVTRRVHITKPLKQRSAAALPTTFTRARVTVETGPTHCTAMNAQARVRMRSERPSGRTNSRPTQDHSERGRETRLRPQLHRLGSGWDVNTTPPQCLRNPQEREGGKRQQQQHDSVRGGASSLVLTLVLHPPDESLTAPHMRQGRSPRSLGNHPALKGDPGP